jgi:hypothetical protein
MALLKKSLGQAPGDAAPAKAAAAKQTKAKEPVRNQPGLKLPIKCGKTAGKAAPQPVEAPAKPSRKRA